MNKVRFFIAVLILSLSFMPRIFAQQIIPGEQLEYMATQKIEELLNNRGESPHREITFSNLPAAVRLPNGIIDIKINIPTINYVSTTRVDAKIYVGGRVAREINLWANIRVYDTVLVANHALAYETHVQPSDFRFEEVALNGRDSYVRSFDEIRGLVTKRYISAGVPISMSYFNQPVGVQSQASVRIIARYGNVTVSAQGTALMRGRIGDVIKVRNDSSKRIISGRVIDAGTVEVTL